jgi:group I intron endonuclease
MYGIIYKVVSGTGKIYIGQTTNTLKRRKRGHIYMAKKGYHLTPFLKELLKQDPSTFIWEQIDSAKTREGLDKKEKYWITYYNAANPKFGYNLTNGGLHFKHAEETKCRISDATKGEKHPMFGKKHSMEALQKMSISAKNRKVPNHAVLTKEEVIQIKIELAKGKHGIGITLAKKYNVKPVTISLIKCGRTWKSVV